MILTGLVGIDFGEDGIRIMPHAPDDMVPLTLSGLGYRDMTLDIQIEPASENGFWLNGEEQQEPFIPATLTGNQHILIHTYQGE